jgi:hypothetical protein
MNGFIVADVVAHVELRTLIHWRDPYYINTEIMEIWDLRGDSREVSPAITCGVLKTSRIDLVDCTVLPPRSLRDSHCSEMERMANSTTSRRPEEREYLGFTKDQIWFLTETARLTSHSKLLHADGRS